MSGLDRKLGLEIVEIPIFPLPNVVLFPNTLLPLHIFEPRYRLMVREALQSSKRIGMALLRNGNEDPQAEGGDVYEIGGMGEIAEIKQLDGGKFDILLSGRRRYRLIQTTRYSPYRRARVQLLRERLPRAVEMERLSAALTTAFNALKQSPVDKLSSQSLSSLDFATLVNSICSNLRIDDHSKQLLLEMNDLKSRAQTLLGVLERQLGQERLISRFDHLRPEDPSVN